MADMTTQIQELYVAYFGRPADYFGLQYWSTFIAQGGSVAAMADNFANSSEYQTMYAGLDSRVLVDTVYEHLFGRHAETAGINYWSALLDQKAITLGDVVTAVADGAQGNDSLVFNAKLEVATVFTTHLDQVSERLAYSGTSANQTVSAYLAAIVDGATAGIAEEPTNIDALIAKLTDGIQLPNSDNAVAHLVGVPDAAPPVHA